MARRGITDKQIADLPRRVKRYTIADPQQQGVYIRVPAKDSAAPISFVAVARAPRGKPVWVTLGSADEIGIHDARIAAPEAIRRIKAGASVKEQVAMAARRKH